MSFDEIITNIHPSGGTLETVSFIQCLIELSDYKRSTPFSKWDSSYEIFINKSNSCTYDCLRNLLSIEAKGYQTRTSRRCVREKVVSCRSTIFYRRASINKFLFFTPKVREKIANSQAFFFK